MCASRSHLKMSLEGGDRVMAQCLTALPALLEELGSMLATTWQLTLVCNSSSRDLTTSALYRLCTQIVHRKTCRQNAHAQNKMRIKK